MVNNLFNYENYPLEVIKNSKLIHTEDGKIKLEVNSSKIERFSGDEPKLIFTDGFKVIFYNTSGKITSNLTANSAIVDEKKNIMTATDSVTLKNNERKLETEILIWDENKDKIYRCHLDILLFPQKNQINLQALSYHIYDDHK